MKAMNHTVSEPGFISLCIELAQSTFSDVMPPRQESGAGTRPAKATANRSGERAGWISRLDDWLYRQQVNAREAYLASSADIFELEARIRHLERRPYY